MDKSKKIILIFFGVFLSFFLLELGLQLAGFIHSSIQKYGNIAAIKRKGSCRILCLGESTTACGGNSSYPRQLETILNKKNIGITFTVINKGIGGGSTNDILAQLEDNIDTYSPHIIITMMGINDSKGIGFIKAKKSLFLSSLKTYKLLRILYRNISEKIKKPVISTKRIGNETNSNLNVPVDYKKQEKILLDKLILNNKNDGTFFELGTIYSHQGKAHKAEIFLKKAIMINPRNEGAYMQLGDLYDMQRQHDKAIDMYRKAIQITPNNANIYVKLGWVYNGQKQFDKAEKVLKEAISIDPGTYRAYMVLGRSYNDRGWFYKAEETYKNAIKLAPKKSAAYYELAWLYYRQKQEDKIEELIDKASDINLQYNGELFDISAFYYMKKEASPLHSNQLEKSGKTSLTDYSKVTCHNYNKLKKIISQKGITLVCVQYPMRNIESLKNILKRPLHSYFKTTFFCITWFSNYF